MNINYHYLIMSQKDLLQNQVIEEILREKSSYYLAQAKTPDYWIIISPTFLTDLEINIKLKKTKFFQNQKNKIIVKSNQNEDLEFYAALVSLDEEFMNWVKLRLGYFEDLFESKESSTLDSYVSDGVFGNFLIEESIVKTKNVLASKSSFVHPDIISSKLVDSIKSFY
jgi:Protein of unknown function (DUF2488)